MNICIVGLGVVGYGVYDILKNDNSKIKVKYVLDLDTEKTKGIDCVTTSLEEVLNDSDLDCVVELIGGTRAAYLIVKESLKAKKHVVTANKALISKYFKELHDLALENGVVLRYEASVGGAINVLDPLLTISKINKINQIEGIINGSTNFILSKIFIDGYTLSKALEEARELGYIETGSNDDLDGLDLMRKINILSMISYNQEIKEEAIIRYPLTKLTESFYRFVKEKGLLIKYIANSSITESTLSIHLEPVIISKDNLYSNINYEENIITLSGEYHKKQSFIGQGAGRYPTASAVIYDLEKISQGYGYEVKLVNQREINNQTLKAYYLIEVAGSITKTELTTLKELLKDDSISSIARIDSGAYESI